MGLTLLEVASDYAVAVSDRIFIFYLRERLAGSELLRVRQALERAGKQGLLGYFQITHPRSVRRLETTERHRLGWVALAEAAKRNAPVGALALLQDGFAGAALRATVSTVLLLARGRKPVAVFDGLEPASQWLAEQLRTAPDAPTEAEILAAVRAVAARLDAA